MLMLSPHSGKKDICFQKFRQLSVEAETLSFSFGERRNDPCSYSLEYYSHRRGAYKVPIEVQLDWMQDLSVSLKRGKLNQ